MRSCCFLRRLAQEKKTKFNDRFGNFQRWVNRRAVVYPLGTYIPWSLELQLGADLEGFIPHRRPPHHPIPTDARREAESNRSA